MAGILMHCTIGEWKMVCSWVKTLKLSPIYAVMIKVLLHNSA